MDWREPVGLCLWLVDMLAVIGIPTYFGIQERERNRSLIEFAECAAPQGSDVDTCRRILEGSYGR